MKPAERFMVLVIQGLFLLCLMAFLTSPLWKERPPHEPAVIGPRAKVELPDGGFAKVPTEWQWTSSPGSEHGVLSLAASNSPGAVRDLVTTTPTTLSVKGVNSAALTRADAYVEIWSTYLPAIGGSRPLPSRFLLEEADGDRSLLGEPILEWTGYGADRNSLHLVTYWVGPDATPSVEAQARFVLAHIHLPTAD